MTQKSKSVITQLSQTIFLIKFKLTNIILLNSFLIK